MLDSSNTQRESEAVSSGPVVLDGRTFNARRVNALVAMFTEALGGTLDPMKRDAVRRAAELQAIAEQLRTMQLKGGTSLRADEVIKAENLADRARRALRIGDAPARTVRPIRERLLAARG